MKQIEMSLHFVIPKLLIALPVWTHGKDDIARVKWYYTCPCGMEKQQQYAIQMSAHLYDVHGLTPSKSKKLLERSRNYYHAHKYDDGYPNQIIIKHKEIA